MHYTQSYMKTKIMYVKVTKHASTYAGLISNEHYTMHKFSVTEHVPMYL